ncbi:NAD(P)/FAD-dependent oxidoreductase [Dyella sp.]|uniref:FAD-dependent oxidoreductase n=1 Tax=Dyella sp. TaxID=1869338 RepID=UPI002ED3F887
MTAKPRIAIVGGGPGGLTLARILHVHGVDTVVFERDSHALERPQGGTLDLHDDGGLLALDHGRLLDAFAPIARYDDQGTRLYDKKGQLLFADDDASAGNRPEVDRTALRDMLLASLPPGSVRWGCQLHQLIDQGDGRWSLELEHGTEGPFDLVVGADGTHSRVRPLLSPYKPQYSGLTFVELGIDDVDRSHPAIAALVGHGKMGVEADGRSLIVQRNGHAHIRGYAIFRVPLDWPARRFDLASPASVRAGLLQEFAGFAENILELFHAANDHFTARPILALPVGHYWPHRRGLTLLGDAAHVMSPFGGDGVNNAMLDAAELARALIEHADVDQAIAAYEPPMFARTEPSAKEAGEAAATFLSHEGLAHQIAIHQGHQAERQALASSLSV